MLAERKAARPRPPRPLRLRRQSRKLGFLLYAAFYGPLVFVRTTYRQLALLSAMFLVGAAIFAHYNGLSPIPAFLASVSTITTIGLYAPNGGDFVTINRTEAVLLIFMILVSVGSAASLLQATVGAYLGGDLAKGKAEEKMIGRLKKHVVVFGYGKTGKYVVEKLNELGLDCVVVTTDALLYAGLAKNNVLAVLEHETKPIDALKQAGIEKAAILIVCHENDPQNMMVTLSARRLRPDIRVVSVVHDADLLDAARSSGADTVVASSVTIGHLLALAAAAKGLVGIVVSEEIGEKEIVRFTVARSSKLIGVGMAEISRSATVIEVVRGSAAVPNLFDASLRLQEGDSVLVLGEESRVEALKSQAEARGSSD